MTKIFMESRRIQKAGKGSYTLNLPLWWVRENKLEKGDKIDILKDKGGKLVLRCSTSTSIFELGMEAAEETGVKALIDSQE